MLREDLVVDNLTRRGFASSFAAAFAASIPAMLGGKRPGEEAPKPVVKAPKPVVKAVEKIVCVDRTPPPRVRPDLSHLPIVWLRRSYRTIEFGIPGGDAVWTKNEFEVQGASLCGQAQWEDFCDRVSLMHGVNINDKRFKEFLDSHRRFDDGTSPRPAPRKRY